MKNLYRLIIAGTAAAVLTCGCAKEPEKAMNEDEKLFFEAWMQTHYPQAEKSGAGIYFIPSDSQGAGTGSPSTDKEPVADSQYVYVSYTAYDLNGNITAYSEAETAKKLGEYESNKTNFFGPRVWTRASGYLYAGINEMFGGMYSGETRKAVIPGWLMSYQWYGSEQEYLDNVSGTNSIYEVKVIDPINDINKWQIDSVGRFFASMDSGDELNFGYLNQILKDKLVNPETSARLTAKDSSDAYGFYFIEINHGEELESDEEEEGSTEEGTGEDTETSEEYDWSKSHFFTTSGSNDTTIYINYVGRLLNGQVFDTNIQRVAQDNNLSGGTYEPVAIQWADSYSELKMGDDDSASSTITGFAMTLWRMHPFGKAIGIFYSGLGYGYSGSGNTIPAYSPLMFEIEIVKEPED